MNINDKISVHLTKEGERRLEARAQDAATKANEYLLDQGATDSANRTAEEFTPTYTVIDGWTEMSFHEVLSLLDPKYGSQEAPFEDEFRTQDGATHSLSDKAWFYIDGAQTPMADKRMGWTEMSFHEVGRDFGSTFFVRGNPVVRSRVEWTRPDEV